MNQLLNQERLELLLSLLAAQVGRKSVLDKNIELRNKYVLNIDYDTDIKFNTNLIIGEETPPYVGTALVGFTYVKEVPITQPYVGEAIVGFTYLP